MPAYDWAVVYVPPQGEDCPGDILHDVQLIDVFYHIKNRDEALAMFEKAVAAKTYDCYSEERRSGAFLARIKWGNLTTKGVLTGIKIIEVMAILRVN